MAETVYILGALTTLLCSVLLFRGYARSRHKLLLWSALCFAMLTLSNCLVFVDLVILRDMYLWPWRLGTAAVAMGLLIFGLIWEGS